MLDSGIEKGVVATGAAAYVVLVFNCIAVFSVIELTFIIWTTFKRRGGLYWWSFNVSTYGVLIYATAFILQNRLPLWQTWFYATLIVIGWPMMVTGQSMVLYSRLHLVLLNRKVLRAVLWMIVINAIIGHIPTFVFIYGVNLNNPGPYEIPYSIYEKVQVTIFFVQECIISALYISETIKTRKLQRDIRPSRSGQRLLKHLIFINVIIIAFDITILGLEYAGYYDIQTSYKGMVYAVKLKLEFSILNKLVEVTTAQKDLSGSSHLSHAAANAIGFPLEVDDHSRGPRRPGTSYRASIRGGYDVEGSTSQELQGPRSLNGVTMTREVEIKREERRPGDEESLFEMRDWPAHGEDGSSTGVIPMEEIEDALKSCSEVHLAPETWSTEAKQPHSD